MTVPPRLRYVGVPPSLPGWPGLGRRCAGCHLGSPGWRSINAVARMSSIDPRTMGAGPAPRPWPGQPAGTGACRWVRAELAGCGRDRSPSRRRRRRGAPPEAGHLLLRGGCPDGRQEPRNRRQFTAEFNAMRCSWCAPTAGRSPRSPGSLGFTTRPGNWVRQDRIDRGEQEGLSSGERARLADLERENARLRMERDLLKRTVAFWVKETSTP
jgi:transposase